MPERNKPGTIDPIVKRMDILLEKYVGLRIKAAIIKKSPHKISREININLFKSKVNHSSKNTTPRYSTKTTQGTLKLKSLL